MNHTPGQWQATEMGSEGWAVFIPHPSSKRGILMMLASNLTETHANLIASAPELLNALKAAAIDIELNAVGEDADELLNTIFMAIAKANAE